MVSGGAGNTKAQTYRFSPFLFKRICNTLWFTLSKVAASQTGNLFLACKLALIKTYTYFSVVNELKRKNTLEFFEF